MPALQGAEVRAHKSQNKLRSRGIFSQVRAWKEEIGQNLGCEFMLIGSKFHWNVEDSNMIMGSLETWVVFKTWVVLNLSLEVPDIPCLQGVDSAQAGCSARSSIFHLFGITQLTPRAFAWKISKCFLNPHEAIPRGVPRGSPACAGAHSQQRGPEIPNKRCFYCLLFPVGKWDGTPAMAAWGKECLETAPNFFHLLWRHSSLFFPMFNGSLM